jgi:site-specific DNA-methyltransferase (adenine-specific)
MAVAIEDAGFEIRDMIEWVYGSGFPKSLNIGKAVDKIQGNEREVLGNKGELSGRNINNHNALNGDSTNFQSSWANEVTKGTSPYEGYGTALKPAHEPCVLARKPIEGTVANNVLKHGTGGLNIDGSRIEAEASLAKNWERNQSDKQSANATYLAPIDKNKDLREYTPTGRFPANLIHDGSDEVVGLFPDSKSSSGGMGGSNPGMWAGKKQRERGGHDDSGSAARFFYTAKASKSERNAGLEGFEEVRESDRVKDDGVGGDNPRNRSNNARANHHPTVKPLSLTKYLANLIKPPTGGRLLVPFSGSGSEMIGALQAGWEHVEGVELTEEYIPIAEARIKYWLEQKAEEDLQPKQAALL